MTRSLLRALALAACVLLSGALPVGAETGFFAAAKLSTLGVGGDVGWKFNRWFAVRANLNGLGWHVDDFTVDSIDFDGQLTLLTLGGVLDVYPFANQENAFLRNLFVSAGVYLNWNEATVNSKINPLQVYNIGGTRFLGATVGAPKATIRYNLVNPYMGLGWQGWFRPDSNWRFQFTAGALFQGQSQVSVSDYNAATPGLPNALAKVRSDIKDRSDQYQVYPVVSLGIGYSF